MNDVRTLLTETQIRIDVNEQSNVFDLESPDIDTVSVERLSGSTYSILFRGHSLTATVTEEEPSRFTFSVDGVVRHGSITNRRMRLLADLGVSAGKDEHEGEISSPMPGLVLKVLVEVGATVRKNEPIIVLEAMKMENEIRSPTNAIVTGVHVSAGESVPKSTLLISLEVDPSST